jgi:nucleolar protein 4
MKPEKQTDPRTVFVRGVSYSTSDADFADFFSAIGPTKQAFLVKSGDSAGHKGYGFVQYALEDDAVRAAAELHGKQLDGKKLKVGSRRHRRRLTAICILASLH